MLSLLLSLVTLSASISSTSALVIRTGETSPSVLSRQTTNSLGCAPFSAVLPSSGSGGTMRRQMAGCTTTCTNGAYLYAATAAGGAECICSNTLDTTQLVESDSAGNCPAGDLAITFTGGAVASGTSSTLSTIESVTATDSSSTATDSSPTATESFSLVTDSSSIATDSSSTATSVISASASVTDSAPFDTAATIPATTDVPSPTDTPSTSTAMSADSASVIGTPFSTVDATSTPAAPTDSPFTSPTPTDTSLSTPTDTTPVASPSSATLTSSPTASASPSSSYTALGCYAEPIEHDFNVRALTNYSSGFIPNLTVEGCISTCASLDWPLAGMEFGSECLCGDGIYNGGNPAPDGNCNAACTGDLSEEECGGTFLFSLYANMTFFESLRAQFPEAFAHIHVAS